MFLIYRYRLRKNCLYIIESSLISWNYTRKVVAAHYVADAFILGVFFYTCSDFVGMLDRQC